VAGWGNIPDVAPERTVEIPADRITAAGRITLPGDLSLAESPGRLVIFAHGSGSSRLSPRNRHVAAMLNEAGFDTLLFDLLTPEESNDRRLVFDIPLLAGRLLAATRWVRDAGPWKQVGYFGASTGAAAALWAAAEMPDAVGAVVSRGGRPDLAMERLPLVAAPTLLIVGSNDREVLELNRGAQRALGSPSELAVVPGAGHLFEEPGALERVAGLAIEWFARHLPSP
jgi:putative phosphoribosyl transferase